MKTVTAESAHAGWRADRTLSILVPELNRRGAKALFHAKAVRLNGRVASGAERIEAGDTLSFPDPAGDGGALLARANAPKLATAHGRQIQRIHEDAVLLVICKPPEVPVHRGQGGYTRRDTLEDVFERAYPPPPNAQRGQQGYYFVHRLDMETSGLLLIAKNDPARDALIKDFSQRRIRKDYLAFVVGSPDWEKITVSNPIAYTRADDAGQARIREGAKPFYKRGRPKPKLRGVKKGVALEEGNAEGKSAETVFTVVQRFRGYTLLRAQPKTGRTHQIRVHLKHLGHPLAYDPLYGRATPLRLQDLDQRSGDSERGEAIVLNRLPLHAWKLAFVHPQSGEAVAFEAPLPRDLKEFYAALKKYRAQG